MFLNTIKPANGSKKARKRVYSDEVRLHELNGIDSDVVDLSALKTAGLLRNDIRKVKIILSGTLEKAVKIRGLRVTKGARAAIESAGGSIED